MGLAGRSALKRTRHVADGCSTVAEDCVDVRSEFGTGLRAALARADTASADENADAEPSCGDERSEPVSPELMLVSADVRYLIVPPATAIARTRRPLP